jgi:hemoglobin-like flavoprotein
MDLAFRLRTPNLCRVQATIIIMTEHQISLIKNSWNQVRSLDPVLVGDVFYSKLFVEAPELYHLFKTPRPEQSKKLIGMISVVVAKLDKLSDLTYDIEQLAKRHVRYGTQPEHYTVVGSALLWTLEVGLSTSWNEELKEAWSLCYGILSSTMIKASEYATETVLS